MLNRSQVPAAAIAAIILATAAAASADARTVTFTEDVAPIMIARCVSCHRPGEGAPMTFLSYAEVRPWAKSIRSAVLQGDMPPWNINPQYGKFSNDLSLTEEQKKIIADWVDQGAPEGPPSAMPPMPEYTDGWRLGEPDYIIELDEVRVAAEGPDVFPNLDAVIDIPENRWIQACEVRPGNPDVLHHVVAFMTDGMPNIPVGGGNDDDSDDSRSGGSLSANVLTFWGAGTPPTVYPEGTGRTVNKGTRLRVNMHYHSYGRPTSDKTRIGLHWGEGPMKKEVATNVAGAFLFKIPPGEAHQDIQASMYFQQDSRITAYFPHMHMRGKSITYTAHYPDGRSEILLDVPKYDFNWQWFYYPEEPVRVPAGTRVDVAAVWDNSAGNPNNPDPSIFVTFGEESNDEMMFGVAEYYVEEGVRPRPVNVSRRVDEILKRFPPRDAYKVRMEMGMMKLPTALHLPREGEAGWHFAFGQMLIDVPIQNLIWNGDDFSFEIEAIGIPGAKLKASGSLTADGGISGTFDFEGVEDLDGELPGTRAFMMKGFEGNRVG